MAMELLCKVMKKLEAWSFEPIQAKLRSQNAIDIDGVSHPVFFTREWTRVSVLA
jgi:hypothetical protein